ncbi:MAG TPA: M28 family peptidase [Terriglobales bacterium]|jgi:Zn-dependent M28 family amino/carboxypeptidase
MRVFRHNLFAFLCMLLLLGGAACTRTGKAASATASPISSDASSGQAAAAAMPAAMKSDDSPETSPPQFNAAGAMQYTKEIVAFGPRPIGSANHKKVEDYILSHLKGDDVVQDAFTVDTTEGKFPVRNIIAKFPGTRDGIVVIASHYDTNWPLKDIAYVGANDGASSSALLLELANQLRGKKLNGYSVWLLWDDAEESMRLPWYDPEALYGVRHLADKWQNDGTLKNIKAFLLEDMIGDADLNIERDQNSTPWLEDLIYQAATRLGMQSHFFERTSMISDDHIPFVQRSVPSADLIDFSYGYNNVFWHTTQDTVDKLSPKSLEIIGTVTLETLRMLDGMQAPGAK